MAIGSARQPGAAAISSALVQLDCEWRELAELRTELDQATEQARLEAERERAVNELLRETVDCERDLNRELQAERRTLLAEGRKPWWRRLLG